ncbi:YojF family protein [Aquibacillus sp. 3ASR75-11]|uniref:YojF family protein n=1 Tax=Terrihalobacillus insolitus TaxID=2950438 RepID=A0A9X3WRP9_9BACI|nr:YojF family protein [Terrihalobacillus insolitus]MDC3412255.1 YojF family protein [Terrihalobacillus insolitus]MDC3423051.1 YojF family protein [Terrihalobacillus insolitus]
MKAIDVDQVQQAIDRYANKPVYIHLETTNGAYASHFDDKAYNIGVFIRNAKISYEHGKIVGTDQAYRVGLKTDMGWVYAEGLSQWEIDSDDRLLMAGHDREGRLMVALEIGEKPFDY